MKDGVWGWGAGEHKGRQDWEERVSGTWGGGCREVKGIDAYRGGEEINVGGWCEGNGWGDTEEDTITGGEGKGMEVGGGNAGARRLRGGRIRGGQVGLCEGEGANVHTAEGVGGVGNAERRSEEINKPGRRKRRKERGKNGSMEGEGCGGRARKEERATYD